MYQIFNTAQNDEDNRICLHKLPTSLIIEFDAPVYIINIFQSAKLKKKKKKKNFTIFTWTIFTVIYRYSISTVKRGTITISRDLNEQRSGAIPSFIKKLLQWRNKVIPKILFIFSFFVFQLFFQNLDRSYLDDTLSFIKYFIQ